MTRLTFTMDGTVGHPWVLLNLEKSQGATCPRAMLLPWSSSQSHPVLHEDVPKVSMEPSKSLIVMVSFMFGKITVMGRQHGVLIHTYSIGVRIFLVISGVDCF